VYQKQQLRADNIKDLAIPFTFAPPMTPTVSVLLPVYNGGRYLQGAVQSILNQSFSDFELIVVDDGSTDNTLSILKSFDDPRLIVLNHERNSGIVATLATGLVRCRGKYIARMDSDDIALPHRLQEQVAFFEAHPDVGVVDTVQTVIDEQGVPVGRTNSPVIEAADIIRTLPKRNCLGHPSVMVKGDLLRAYGYRNVAYEDYDLWLRLTASDIRIVKLRMPLLLFREHTTSITGKDEIGVRQFLKIIQTKRFYLSHLTFTEAIKPFNLAVRFWLMRDIATHTFKKIKSMMSR
jgi:glycosyltransferase involved in cell wall biosynthesis